MISKGGGLKSFTEKDAVACGTGPARGAREYRERKTKIVRNERGPLAPMSGNVQCANSSLFVFIVMCRPARV